MDATKRQPSTQAASDAAQASPDATPSQAALPSQVASLSETAPSDAAAPPQTMQSEMAQSSGAANAAADVQAFAPAPALNDVSIPRENSEFQRAIEPQEAQDGASDNHAAQTENSSFGDAPSNNASSGDAAPHMSTHVAAQAAEDGEEEARAPRADRDYLSDQVIGQSPLLPPRQPLGARLATSMGRRHGVLLALCTLGLWAAMTLRPNVQGENYRRGAIASQNILAPRAATLPDRKLTEARKRDAAALVPAVYDGSPDALAFALAQARAIASARRESSTALFTDAPTLSAAPSSTSSQADSSQAASSSALSNPANTSEMNTARASSASIATSSEDATSTDATGTANTSQAARSAQAEQNASPGALSPSSSSKSAVSSGETRHMSTHVAHSGSVSRSGGAARANQSAIEATTAARWNQVAQQKSTEVAARRLKRQLQSDGARVVPFEIARSVVQIAPERWKILQSASEAAIRAAYFSGDALEPVRSDHLADDLAAAWRRGREETQRQSRINRLSPTETSLVEQLARLSVQRPNMLINKRKTDIARQEARNDVNAVSRDIKLGDILVGAGNVIDDDKWALLQDMDLVAARFDPALALARLVLCFVLVLFCACYVARFHPQLMTQPAQLWLAAFVPVAFVAFFRVLLRVPGGDGAMVPLVATGAMLLTILLNARVGFVGAFSMSALCAIMAHADSGLYLATMLGASVGVLGVADISSRVSLLRAAGVLSLTDVALCLAVGTLQGTRGEQLVILATWAAASGCLSVIVTYCLVMFLERPFGITTHLRLLELSAPDEAVLRRMQAEAPGTYTHSVMVAQLSEMAAKAVGADPLLCRVGGLYHDIGKLRRPHCFIENQNGDNVHDRLSPQMSALIIVAHVKDGLELGRALQLPQPVLDIIAQHHGTTLISYFYDRAQREIAAREAAQHENGQNEAAQHQDARHRNGRHNDDREDATREESNGSPRMSTHVAAHEGVAWRGEAALQGVASATNGANGRDAARVLALNGHREETAPRSMDESLFRYPGPRPQSKEAALVLLADTIEASSRALPDLTPERLESHIKAMVSARLASGELAECELTMRDLGTIERSFLHVLRGVLHQRIAYPDPDRDMKQDVASVPHARDWMRGHNTTERSGAPRHANDSASANRPALAGSRAAQPDVKMGRVGRNGREPESNGLANTFKRRQDDAERRGDRPDRRRARRQATEISNARETTASVLAAHLNHHAKTYQSTNTNDETDDTPIQSRDAATEKSSTETAASERATQNPLAKNGATNGRASHDDAAQDEPTQNPRQHQLEQSRPPLSRTHATRANRNSDLFAATSATANPANGNDARDENCDCSVDLCTNGHAGAGHNSNGHNGAHKIGPSATPGSHVGLTQSNDATRDAKRDATRAAQNSDSAPTE